MSDHDQNRRWRPAISVGIYIVGYFVSFRIFTPDSPFVLSIVVPIVLGLAVGLILKAKTVPELWPALVSPVIVMVIRLIREPWIPDWGFEDWALLCALTLCASVLVAGSALVAGKVLAGVSNRGLKHSSR